MIDNSLDLSDIQDETFVGCYTEDINRPFLDSHVFLLYEWGDKKSAKVFYKFRDIKSFYGYKIIYIKGKSYIVYTFTSNFNIRKAVSGNIVLGEALKMRICDFWHFKDDWVTWNAMRGTIACDPPSGTVPEEDYLEE